MKPYKLTLNITPPKAKQKLKLTTQKYQKN